MTDVPQAKAAATSSDIPSVLRLPIQYWKQSVAVIAVIVVVAGGYALFNLYQKSQDEKAEQALSKLVATTKGADLVTALTQMAASAPAGVRAAVNLELAKAAQDAGDFTKAASAWEAVAKEAPASMRLVLRQIAQAAGSATPILFRGEEGTGKESLAQYLHDQSHRRTRPFSRLGCASMGPKAQALPSLPGWRRRSPPTSRWKT